MEEYRRDWLPRAQLLSRERDKALEAQTDLLKASAGQLGACVALGRAVVASEDWLYVLDDGQVRVFQ